MPIAIQNLQPKEIQFQCKTDLHDEGMHFVNINSGKAELQFSVDGQVISAPSLNEKFGYIGISFEPDAKDMNALYELQELMNPASSTFNRHLRSLGLTEGDFKKIYGGDVKEIFYKNLLYLKLKPTENKESFQFYCNKAEFKPSDTTALQPYDRVKINLRPGLFFNNDTGKAGWFFSVKALLFETVTPQPSKGRKKN